MPQPNKIPRPFADSGDKNSIPDSSGSIGFASWQEGFPAITSEPFASGGVAPKRADFNGIFNALSAATLWYQQGGFYAYDNTTDYEVGNVVEYSGDLYKCRTANGPSSSVKAPTDTTAWDAIATASGFLPLSGGTMTGAITSTVNTIIKKTDTTGSLIFLSGNNSYSTSGANIVLCGGSQSTDPGQFTVQAGNANGYKQLIGKPDGTLTWGGKDIPVIETGTFTPTIFGGTTAGVFTYTNQSGSYVKFGSLCYVDFRVDGKIVTAPTGYTNIGGLPYISASANQSLLINAGPAANILNYPPIMIRLSSSQGTGNFFSLNHSNSTLAAVSFASGLAVGTVVVIRACGIYRVA